MLIHRNEIDLSVINDRVLTECILCKLKYNRNSKGGDLKGQKNSISQTRKITADLTHIHRSRKKNES